MTNSKTNQQPLKFRAWDRHSKKMFSCKNKAYLLYNGKLITFQNNEDIIVMQFTGLFDCDGKEIYEGDIIHIEAYANYSVYFWDGYFATNLLQKDATETYMLDSRLLIDGSQEGRKIIGNVFENPELVENS